jgi:mono/diheme cytochrome c family protein
VSFLRTNWTVLISSSTRRSSVTLRRAEKAEDVVLRSQIAEIQATAKSVMPEELEKQLTKQDLADVIGYLLAAGGK